MGVTRTPWNESMDSHIQNERLTRVAANGADDNRLGVTRTP